MHLNLHLIQWTSVTESIFPEYDASHPYLLTSLNLKSPTTKQTKAKQNKQIKKPRNLLKVILVVYFEISLSKFLK